MKILYAIQGTGNGHVCRALEIVPLLMAKADVDVLISGSQSDVQLPFPVKYVFNGLSFIFGKKGGVDIVETYKKSHIKQLLKEIHSLSVDEYDLVISDFEPVSSWSCHLQNKTCIALSHQAAVLNKKSPQPAHTDPVGKAILKIYAPSSIQYGFHFKEYDENIFTPVIRKDVRAAAITDEGHYTVYLPAYSDKRIISVLSKCEGICWHIFSKHFKYKINSKNVKVFPINDHDFIKSMSSAHGVLCGAGFETPAEALYLKKKLLVIPMKNQFEQHCNAAALKELGVSVMKSLKKKHVPFLQEWLQDETIIFVNYQDCTNGIIEHILQRHYHQENSGMAIDSKEKYTMKDFRRLTLKRILYKLAN